MSPKPKEQHCRPSPGQSDLHEKQKLLVLIREKAAAGEMCNCVALLLGLSVALLGWFFPAIDSSKSGLTIKW